MKGSDKIKQLNIAFFVLSQFYYKKLSYIKNTLEKSVT